MSDWTTLSNTSGTDFTVVWTDKTYERLYLLNEPKDPLEQMKEDFDVLKDKFFLEKL